MRLLLERSVASDVETWMSFRIVLLSSCDSEPRFNFNFALASRKILAEGFGNCFFHGAI